MPKQLQVGVDVKRLPLQIDAGFSSVKHYSVDVPLERLEVGSHVMSRQCCWCGHTGEGMLQMWVCVTDVVCYKCVVYHSSGWMLKIWVYVKDVDEF